MNKRLFICIVSCVLATSTLYAQDQNQERKHGAHKRPEMSAELKAVLDGCHTSLNIPKPVEGAARPTRNQMEQLRACVETQGYNFPGPREGEDGERRGRPAGDEQQTQRPQNATAQ